MAAASLKVEFPRRQAMLTIYQPLTECYPWQDISVSKPCKLGEVARVPVLVWPMPTQEGKFIVEHQDGSCEEVYPFMLTFLDSKELFDQYGWSEV